VPEQVVTTDRYDGAGLDGPNEGIATAISRPMVANLEHVGFEVLM